MQDTNFFNENKPETQKPLSKFQKKVNEILDKYGVKKAYVNKLIDFNSDKPEGIILLEYPDEDPSLEIEMFAYHKLGVDFYHFTSWFIKSFDDTIYEPNYLKGRDY